jgi:hypothetical protein
MKFKNKLVNLMELCLKEKKEKREEEEATQIILASMTINVVLAKILKV